MSGIINRTTRRILNIVNSDNFQNKAKFAVPAVVAGIWGAQTSYEYKHAAKEDKQNSVINNVLIAAGMVTGGLLGYKGVQRFMNNPPATDAFSRNFFNKIGEFLRKYPAKNFLEALSVPLGSGISGGVFGEVAQRSFPLKYDEPEELLQKTNSYIESSLGPISQVMFPGSNVIETIDPSFATMVGYSVGKEKGVKKKIKKFISEIIGSSIVPVAIVLPITTKLSSKINNKAVLATIAGGTGIIASFAGKAAASWFDKKVTDKMLENKLWEDIALKQRQLIQASMFTNNPIEKQQIQNQVQSLKTLEHKIKKADGDISSAILKLGYKARSLYNNQNSDIK
ncbi:MAG TPA: hypothetical protein P5556_09365 [Candidatus Gastranaerophilales bacterium]|nr:hypothetical protein [Candidatus Gastranaerophilales bacterium]